MTKRLDKHQIVGIDIDSTLIGAPTSPLLVDWIKQNHKSKELHVVTFRTDLWYKKIPDDFLKEDIDINWFASINGLPDFMYNTYVQRNHYYKALNGKRYNKARNILKFYNIAEKDLDNNWNDLITWKGLKCFELGATVLIDDDLEKVQVGCTKHNIELIDSLSLR